MFRTLRKSVGWPGPVSQLRFSISDPKVVHSNKSRARKPLNSFLFTPHHTITGASPQHTVTANRKVFEIQSRKMSRSTQRLNASKEKSSIPFYLEKKNPSSGICHLNSN